MRGRGGGVGRGAGFPLGGGGGAVARAQRRGQPAGGGGGPRCGPGPRGARASRRACPVPTGGAGADGGAESPAGAGPAWPPGGAGVGGAGGLVAEPPRPAVGEGDTALAELRKMAAAAQWGRGGSAVRTGQDASGRSKPPWLRQKGAQGAGVEALRGQLQGLKLATVCEEARCPNLGECWGGGGEHGISTATIMIMGDTCTRGCKFCAVDTHHTPPALDEDEPEKTAEAVASWGVGYVVLTSVDRDDLPDGGSDHFARTVRALKLRKPDILVEVLAPDFQGVQAHVAHLAGSGLDVFAHNVETVERLQGLVRDKRAAYQQSLDVLAGAKEEGVYTKTSLMLGFGETDDEIRQAMRDIRGVGVDIVTFGQYLQPTPLHLPVKEYVTPEKFDYWRDFGEQELGFRFVPSGPLVRSSYKAGEYFIENMIKSDREKIRARRGEGGLHSLAEDRARR